MRTYDVRIDSSQPKGARFIADLPVQTDDPEKLAVHLLQIFDLRPGDRINMAAKIDRETWQENHSKVCGRWPNKTVKEWTEQYHRTVTLYYRFDVLYYHIPTQAAYQSLATIVTCVYHKKVDEVCFVDEDGNREPMPDRTTREDIPLKYGGQDANPV